MRHCAERAVPGVNPVAMTARWPVRPVRDAAEEAAAGRVTAAAYEEFRPGFAPAEWDRYAATLPATRARVEQGELLVALDGDTVVGTVTLYLEPRPTSGHWRDTDAMVRFLAVDPGRRGEGIGQALFHECLRRAAVAGKKRVALQTTPSMTAAVALYERDGFTRDPEGDREFGSFSLRGYAKDLT
jgi:ribosomal protein S18 acetylase RimI-like enzyme